MKMWQKATMVLSAAALLVLPYTTNAVTLNEVDVYTVPFDAELISKGYTIASPSNDFRLGIFPDVLSGPTDFVLKRRDFAAAPVLPEGWVALSDYWEFDVVDKTAYDGTAPVIVQMEYQDLPYPKKVVFWNGTEWQEIPSQLVTVENKQLMRAFFHLPYARFLVVGEEVMTSGVASWYAYKDCDCAASPDFPKGSVVRVTSQYSGKFVDVTINDYGPDRSIHPDRVIDLDVVAFEKLAPLGAGLINVDVEPLSL